MWITKMFAKIKNNKIVLIALVVVLITMSAPLTKAGDDISAAKTTGGKAADVVAGVSVIASVIALAPVLVPLGALLYAVMYFSGWFINFIANFANYIIDYGNNILTNAAVLAGWKVMLNFTNLGFILAIIIIAFATILRLESYAIKQTLWKLIVAALLVNFSLVICGGIISVSKLTTDSFYNHITAGGKTMGNVLGTLAQPQEVTAPIAKNVLEKTYDAAKSFLSLFTATGQLNFVVGLAFQLVMNFIIILTFLTLIVMLLVRIIALIFLLILSPIAWLLWIFPNTQKYWQQWWQEFIRWNFFAPVIMFFIYLAVLTRNKMAETKLLGEVTKSAVENVSFFTNLWMSIMDNVVIAALLIGGIYVANKFGIAGGQIGINLAKGVGKGAGAWVGRKTLGGIRGGYGRLAGAAGWGDKSIEASKKAGESTGIKRYFYGLKARTYANLSAPAEREPGIYKAEVSKLTPTQVMAQLSSKSMTMPGGRKAALSEYIKDNIGKINIPGTERREKIEDIMEDRIVKTETTRDSDGNIIQTPITQKVKTGERKTGEYENVNISDKLKGIWLEKNLGTGSMENLYKRSKMDYSAIEKTVLGQSRGMIDAKEKHGVGSEEFSKEASKFFKGLKKSDAAGVGKAIKGVFGTTVSLRDSDERTLAKQIAIALGHNFSIISTMLPNLGGYNVTNNFKTDFEEANPHLRDEFTSIFKNFRIFEGGTPSSTTASASPTQ